MNSSGHRRGVGAAHFALLQMSAMRTRCGRAGQKYLRFGFDLFFSSIEKRRKVLLGWTEEALGSFCREWMGIVYELPDDKLMERQRAKRSESDDGTMCWALDWTSPVVWKETR
jgi:hypothetical protein